MDGMETVLNALPQRLRAAGWSVALPPVMLVCIVYWGLRPSTVTAVLLAGLVTMLAPAVAADLAAIALIGFASCAFALIWRTARCRQARERQLATRRMLSSSVTGHRMPST
jgi:hypothetical protein